MPYHSIAELPDNVRDHVPKHAQEIYKEAFNSAWEQYDKPGERRGDASREETAHKVAWSAVKDKYEKGDDGDWRAK
ncbi:putative cation transport regulator ChaB [Luteimonas sp. R10]|uniref:putative cation transport regulator ChaB n=1 Tax=Luteimonas sp. R10 TaxID=3108176 RepID=UPI003091ECB1|nr:putative cation transport regulator ChaB [Luteimonas sp. R10]